MNIRAFFIAVVVFSFSLFHGFSQGVGIGTSTPDPTAKLEISSTTQGTLITRMTSVQRDAIVSPAEGLLIFNTTTKCLNIFKNNGWFDLCGTCIPPATPVIAAPAAVCEGDSIVLSASGIPNATYQWSGPANFSSNQQSPVITATTGVNSGVYSVIAVVNNCSSAAASAQVIVHPIPDAGFTFSPSTPDSSQSVTFNPNQPGATYAWTFAYGNPSVDTQQNPIVKWDSIGTFPASLTVVQNGCSASTSDTISVVSCPSGSQTFNYSGGVVTYQLPSCVTKITVEAYGAEGGRNQVNDRIGGKGAKMKGEFTVQAGSQLRIVVGGQGQPGWNNPYGAGSGGGASAVSITGSSVPLIVAGGGGGAGGRQGTYHNGGDGLTSQNGDIPYPNGSSAGGTGGNGGNGGIGHQHCGAAGAGWYTDGYSNLSEASAGKALSGSAMGGQAGPYYGAQGGFGGGGGSNIAGGGGGGYSGGAGGDQLSGWIEFGGGGGGSFNSGSNQDNVGGVRTGDGLVIISW
jgi:hypothetical protein